MKLRKYNEHKRNTKKAAVVESDEEKLSKMKTSWQEYEDEQPWEFDMFWDKISQYYNDWQRRYHGSVGYYEIEMYGSAPESSYTRYHGNTNRSVIYQSEEWRKRNGRIQVKVNTGGSSGGSCWDSGDDPGSQPYETGDYTDFHDQLGPFLEHILTYILGHNHPLYDIKQLVQELYQEGPVHTDTYTNYEYYGNYDDYSLMWVTLWDLYKFANDKRAL
jgi:hypothetical protein